MSATENTVDPTRLDGQWAVVTGSSKGIGLGIAETFVDAGASVLLVARGQTDLDAAAEELRGRAADGQEIRTVTADTSSLEGVEALFATIAELPSLDVFVANTGAGVPGAFLEISDEDWDWCINLNLTGTFRCVQRAAKAMIAGGRDNRSIIVVSSIRALGARPTIGAYAAAKAGINMMCNVAAQELAPEGVRVNILSPGITATPMAQEGNPELFAERTKNVPMGRAGTPRDMGEGARYLASPAARFVTGTNLVIDGGEVLW